MLEDKLLKGPSSFQWTPSWPRPRPPRDQCSPSPSGCSFFIIGQPDPSEGGLTKRRSFGKLVSPGHLGPRWAHVAALALCGQGRLLFVIGQPVLSEGALARDAPGRQAYCVGARVAALAFCGQMCLFFVIGKPELSEEACHKMQLWETCSPSLFCR